MSYKDLFKKVNNTYSHQIGNEVLKCVAILMQMNWRKERRRCPLRRRGICVLVS
ncbi:MAG: hypothetical protein ACK412_06395 [Chloroherpetonaceae bacterium]